MPRTIEAEPTRTDSVARACLKTIFLILIKFSNAISVEFLSLSFYCRIQSFCLLCSVHLAAIRGYFPRLLWIQTNDEYQKINLLLIQLPKISKPLSLYSILGCDQNRISFSQLLLQNVFVFDRVFNSVFMFCFPFFKLLIMLTSIHKQRLCQKMEKGQKSLKNSNKCYFRSFIVTLCIRM